MRVLVIGAAAAALLTGSWAANTNARMTAGAELNRAVHASSESSARTKVDSAALAAVRNNGSAQVIVTVQYRDALPGPSQGRAVPSEIRSSGRIFARRKDAALAAAGSDVQRRRDYEVLPVVLVHVNSEAALLRLAASPNVVSIRADRRSGTHLAQSLPLVNQPQVAAAGYTGAGTAVAVLDTGVDFTRAAFGSCQSAGAPGCAVAFAQDFAPDDGQPDDNDHGTNVAGIVLGVAPG
ncbi:MAG TPA: S8 family serine peptidase, partial [Solirubrobacter sp.]|nr:S8 family serine peptidase [Solirubrobacter sp.]